MRIHGDCTAYAIGGPVGPKSLRETWFKNQSLKGYVGGSGNGNVRPAAAHRGRDGRVAGLVRPGISGWPASRSSIASAQSAFDLSAGTPGCFQVALMFNIGAGYDPAVGILDTLGFYGVPASMFVMGWLAEQNPWLVQQISAWGHPVGSHGYVPPELTIRSDDDIAWDLQAASDALSWALGYHPGPWFTPYASASDDRVRSIASSLGLITVGWSVGSGDWDREPAPKRSMATSSVVRTMARLSSCISMLSAVSTERQSPCHGLSRT